MKNLKAGFTLVELMIVVAIIGILAAIAVPNYQKYQSKARQSEVKLSLSGAYTALQSYVVENNSYTGCLGAIGVGVTAGNRYYSFGLAAPLLMTYSNGVACSAGNGMEYFGGTIAANGGTAVSGAPVSAATTVSTNAFTLGGQGNIGGNTRPNDVWTINEAKTLSNTASGL